MDKQDLDLLLQARTSELQHEYQNLVRSLDAAYETVKAIGHDIAENRAEARRLFDTRLKLARGDDLEAVLRLCSSDATTTTNNVQNKVNGRKLNDNTATVDQLPGMVRLYVQQSDATSSRPTSTQQQHIMNLEQQPRVVTVTSSAMNVQSRLRPIHSFDTASMLIEQLQQQQNQQQQHEEPHYSPVYVGDDHSYAVNEEEDEDLAEHQLMLEERLMVADTSDAKRRRGRDNITGGVDLSIVKTECPDNSLEEQNPLVDHQKPATIAKNPKIQVATLSKRSPQKVRKVIEGDDEDELVRKRKQTRERMRRWRAKKKMEEINAKQPYKYKLVIAKTATA